MQEYDLTVNQSDYSNDYKYLYSKILPYAKPYILRGLLGILMAIPVGALDGVMPFALKIFLDNVLPSRDFKLVAMVAVGVVIFAIIQGCLRYLSTYLNDWSGRKITNAVKIDLFKKMVYRESSFYDTNNSGIIIARFCSDADGASAGLLSNFKTILTMVCSASAFVCVLIYNSWQLALIAIVALSISILPVALIKKKVKYVSHEGMKLGGRFLVTLNETIIGNKMVSSYNLQERQLADYTNKINEGFNLGMKLTKSVNWLSPVMYTIASIGFALVILGSSYLLFADQLTIGRIASFAAALLLLYKPIKTIGNTLAGMQGSFEAMNRVINLLEMPTTVNDVDDATDIDNIKRDIEFKNVWFEYEQGKPILKNINLQANAGETLALVGNSGGGKSTLVNLIPRFYDVTEGSVLIDGIDVRNISQSSLRSNISIVFQDNFLFSGTIRDNILLGKANATDSDIKKAIEDAYLSEFIDSLEMGLDTEIGERGTKLSGGQKQRLAIARALIKDAPVVILDEATSALDNKSEAIVQKALDKLMENRTVFVIAHRLSTIKNADRIAVINEGNIVEIGSHDKLITNNGPYKVLYDAQFKSKDLQKQ